MVANWSRPRTYQYVEGGGDNPPFGEDPFQRILRVHWPIGVVEQALLVIDINGPTAVALDTGESFSGVNSGATGKLLNEKPFTVFTAGMVVFGKPRDGDACFMACTDGATIQRGIQAAGGNMEEIVWSPVYSISSMRALSFAGGVFFVTHLVGDDDRAPSGCAVSFDGTSFSEIGNLYSGVPLSPDYGGQNPGSVAHNGKSYATAGTYDVVERPYPIYSVGDNNLMWASSSDGVGWSAGYSTLVTDDPGINANSIDLANGLIYTTIAGGAGRFVAIATSRTLFDTGDLDVNDEHLLVTLPTAAAAISSGGNSWSTIKLPGAIQAFRDDTGTFINQGSSQAGSVVFIKTGTKAGYFVISANGVSQIGSDQTTASWCWKGNGDSWNMVQSGATVFGTVSAIAQDLSATKIINL